MAYTLTLTAADRKAIDWIGARYTNGNDLYKLLWKESEQHQGAWANYDSEDRDWDAPTDITFKVPEYAAWQIRDNAECEDGSWPCFSPELAAKMQAFVDSIV